MTHALVARRLDMYLCACVYLVSVSISRRSPIHWECLHTLGHTFEGHRLTQPPRVGLRSPPGGQEGRQTL